MFLHIWKKKKKKKVNKKVDLLKHLKMSLLTFYDLHNLQNVSIY